MKYTNAVLDIIEKLVGELKGEDHLVEALKRKLTKKEFKVLSSKIDGLNDDEISKEVRIDLERVDEVYKALCKKINQERIKQELCR